jgi:hypothetical protein
MSQTSLAPTAAAWRRPTSRDPKRALDTARTLALAVCGAITFAALLLAPPPLRAQESESPLLPLPEPLHVEHKTALWHEEAAEAEDVHPGFIGSVEYLYLKPRRRGLDYALVDPLANGRPEGYLASADWEARSGVRAGLAYRFWGAGWEVGFIYTYLHTDRSASVSAPPAGTLYTVLTQPGPVEQAQTATALTSLTYNVYDAELARWFDAGCGLQLRPIGGLRFAHITQGLDAFYDGRDANNDLVSNTIKFAGGGLRGGCEGEWYCGCCGFGLYGRAAVSLLVGDFEATTTETNDGGQTVIANVSDKFQKVVPVFELALGGCYRYRNLRMRAGYEFTNWFGLVDSPDFADDVHQGKVYRRIGDLGLDGLFLRGELAF